MPFYGLYVVGCPCGPASQPFFWLKLEEKINQVDCFRAHFFGESHFTLENQLEGLVICISFEGYLSCYHLVDDAAQGPDVAWGARDVIIEHLRAHIEWSPYESPFPVLDLRFFLLLNAILLRFCILYHNSISKIDLNYN